MLIPTSYNIHAGTCPHLPNPANGRVIQPSPIVEGSTAMYLCDTLYVVMGVSTRTCQSGMWSGNAPTCKSSMQ